MHTRCTHAYHLILHDLLQTGTTLVVHHLLLPPLEAPLHYWIFVLTKVQWTCTHCKICWDPVPNPSLHASVAKVESQLAFLLCFMYKGLRRQYPTPPVINLQEPHITRMAVNANHPKQTKAGIKLVITKNPLNVANALAVPNRRPKVTKVFALRDSPLVVSASSKCKSPNAGAHFPLNIHHTRATYSFTTWSSKCEGWADLVLNLD